MEILCLMAKVLMRLGVGLTILILFFSCGNIPGLREERTTSFIRVPFVRVLLEEDSDTLRFSADASFAIECLQDGKQRVYYSGQPVYTVNKRHRLSVFNASGDPIEENLDEVNIIPRGSKNRLRTNGRRYRGLLKILPDGEAMQLINIVYMEDYLRGVVPPELGPRTEEEIEAVKAQAVASRTYAMAHLKQYGKAPYDMKSSIIDQVYDGLNVENRMVNRAIDETAGKVIYYQDELINAYYHSTCGGMTDDIEHVWEQKEVPYLKAVSDGKACSWSKYYTWKERFTQSQLRGRIEQYLSSDRGRDLRIGNITDVIVGKRTPGGRVEKLSVRTDGNVYSFRKDRIRWVIGRTSNPDLILPSDRFDVKIERDQEGALAAVTFVGRGYGHGVGMCQCGAIGQAREGKLFEDILTSYYSDVELRKLY